MACFVVFVWQSSQLPEQKEGLFVESLGSLIYRWKKKRPSLELDREILGNVDEFFSRV